MYKYTFANQGVEEFCKVKKKNIKMPVGRDKVDRKPIVVVLIPF